MYVSMVRGISNGWPTHIYERIKTQAGELLVKLMADMDAANCSHFHSVRALRPCWSVYLSSSCLHRRHGVIFASLPQPTPT